MGAKETTTNYKDSFNTDQWTQIPLTSYTKNNDPYYSSHFTLYSHNFKNIQLQKYDLFFNGPAQYRTYYESYQWRKNIPNLVQPRYLQEITKRDLCATFYSAAIYIQRIPIRLYQIIDIPIEEGAYVLRTSLQGFSMIFQKTGYFDISPELICINRQGKVKVWANKNLSKNFPQFSAINHNKNESEFIEKIIKVIQQSIDFQQNQKFSLFLAQKIKSVKFQNIFIFLSEYLRNQSIHSSRQMGSILELYKEKQKSFDNHNHSNSNSSLPLAQNKPKKSVFKLSNSEINESSSVISKGRSYKGNEGKLTNLNLGNRRNLNAMRSDRNYEQNERGQDSRKLTPKKNNPNLSYSGRFESSINNCIYNSNDISLDNTKVLQSHQRIRNNYTPVAFYYKNNNGVSSLNSQIHQKSFQNKKSNFSINQNIPQNQTSQKDKKAYFKMPEIKKVQSFKTSQKVEQQISKKQQVKEQKKQQTSINNKIQQQTPIQQKPLQSPKMKKYKSKGESNSKKSKKSLNKIQYYAQNQYCQIDPQIAKDLENYQSK